MNYTWTTSQSNKQPLKIHSLKGTGSQTVHLKAEFCKSQNDKLPRIPLSFRQAPEAFAKNKEHKRFWNQTFDKGRLKNFVLWFLLKYGEHKTVRLVEELKTLGFQYATKAGISLGIEDLKIPKKKNTLIMEAEQLSVTTVKQYRRNEITGVERFQRLIDTWHRTSERLKQEVIENFETTDILNPVYMMAFSGARGNISQVRQLVGMRGLMSNPQGQIIDFPIRSNFREGLTLTEYIISSYGARKGIVDTALRTANAGYLTRRLVDVAQHVIISNFDCGTKRGIFLTDMKEGNKTIYSLQNRLIGRVLARDVFNQKKVKIASRNLEISSDLASSLSSIWTASPKGQDCQSVKIFVRSTLTCQTKNLVCQLCYGWSLAQGNLVGIGEAVGVVAAQSIGEPGTQLTMRTFHTGGVFSGDVSDQIRAPFNGFVFYDNPIAGTLIRTPEGKIAFLTKNEGSFSVFSYFPSVKPLDGLDDQSAPIIKDIKKYKIPFYTLLFFKNGEKVLEKEVIAQISSINRQKIATDQAEFTINAELSGQFFSKLLNLKENKVGPKLKGQALAQLTRASKNSRDNQNNPILGSIKSKKGDISQSILDVKKSSKQNHQGTEVIVEQFNENIVDTIYEAWGWGYAWVLSGKIYQLPLASTFFPVIGDFVNNQTYMNKNRLTLSSSFGNSFKLSVPLNKFSFNTKVIKQMRQSVSTVNPGNNSSTLRKGPPNKISKSYKNNMLNSLNSFAGGLSPTPKNLTLLKTEIISFQLSKIIYKKFGYFLKLNDSANFSGVGDCPPVNKTLKSDAALWLPKASGAADWQQSGLGLSLSNNKDNHPTGLTGCQKGTPSVSKTSILSTEDTLFLFSSLESKSKQNSINNFSGLNGSNLEQYKNNFVYPSRWLSSFDVFLNWFPKRLYTKKGGLIFMEPVFFDTSLSKKVLNNFFKGRAFTEDDLRIDLEKYGTAAYPNNISTQLLKSFKKEVSSHRGPIPFVGTASHSLDSLHESIPNIAGCQEKKYSPNYSIKKYFKGLNKKIKNVSSIYIETDCQSDNLKGVPFSRQTWGTGLPVSQPPLNIKFFPTFVKRDFLKNKYKLDKFNTSIPTGYLKNKEIIVGLTASPVNAKGHEQPTPSINKVSINNDLSVDNDISKNLIFEQYQSKQLGTVTYIGRSQSFNKNKIKSELITYGLNWKNRFKLNFNEFSSGSSSFKAEYSLKYPAKESTELKSEVFSAASAPDRLAMQYHKYMGYQNKVENLQRIFSIPQSFFNFSLEKLILNSQGFPVDYFNTLRSDFIKQGNVNQPKDDVTGISPLMGKFVASELDFQSVNPKLYERSQFDYSSSNNLTAFCQINRQGKFKIFNLGEGYFDGYIGCSNKKNKLDDCHEYPSAIGCGRSIKKGAEQPLKYLRVVKNRPIFSFNSLERGTGWQASNQSEFHNNQKPENIKMLVKFFYDINLIEKLGLPFQSFHSEYSKNSDCLLKQLRKRIKVNNSLDISKSFSLTGYVGSLKSFSKIVSFPYFLNKKSTVFLNKKILTTTSNSLAAKALSKIKNKRKETKTAFGTWTGSQPAATLGHFSHKKTSLGPEGTAPLKQNFNNSKTSSALSILRLATGLPVSQLERHKASKKKQLKKNKKLNKFSLFNFYFYSLFNKNFKKNINLYNLSNSFIVKEPSESKSKTLSDRLDSHSSNYNYLKKLLNKNHLKFIFLKNKFLWMQLKCCPNINNLSGLAGQLPDSTIGRTSHIVSQKNLNSFLSNLSKMSQTILFNSIKNKKINQICSPYLKTQLKYFFHLSKVQPINDFLIYPPHGDSSLGPDCLPKGLFNGAVQPQSEKTSGTRLAISQKVCTGIYKILSLNNFLLNSSFVYSNLNLTYNKGFLYLGLVENKQPGLASCSVLNKMAWQPTESHFFKNSDYQSLNTLMPNTSISGTGSQSTTWMTGLVVSPGTLQIEKRKKKLQFWLKKSLHYKKIYLKNLLKINKKLYSYLFAGGLSPTPNNLVPESEKRSNSTTSQLQHFSAAYKKQLSFESQLTYKTDRLSRARDCQKNRVRKLLIDRLQLTNSPNSPVASKKYRSCGNLTDWQSSPIKKKESSSFKGLSPTEGSRRLPVPKKINISMKPGWFYFTKNISKYILYNKKFIHPGKIIAEDLIFDRESIYLEIIPLDVQNKSQPVQPQLNMSKSGLDISGDCFESVGSPADTNIKFSKIIKNNKCRFEPDWLIFNADGQSTDLKTSVSLGTGCQNTCFLVFIRKANEYKLYKDIEYKKEMRKIATASQKSKNLFEIIPTVKSNIGAAKSNSHLGSAPTVNKYCALINKVKKTGFLGEELSRSTLADKSKVLPSCIRKLENKKKNYSCFKALGPTVDIYTQFKTTLLNKQKIAPQIISKYPSSDLKVISNISFYSSLIMFKNKLFRGCSFNSLPKRGASEAFPFTGTRLTVSYMGQSASSEGTAPLNISQNINKRNSWGLSFSTITAISSINFSPFILTYKAPYSLDFPFKNPLRFFSEPYLTASQSSNKHYMSSLKKCGSGYTGSRTSKKGEAPNCFENGTETASPKIQQTVKKYLTGETGNNHLFYLKKILII
jgi:hypothetical protein